ncbi:MAG: hypothetical protein JWQ35_353 [Bacteriovoracaceae bacterium]|nr:hypothetical protein [Bacteriovoracaceae bacterium]
MNPFLQIVSPARLEVLRILFETDAPLKLRRIADLADVSMRPLQLAVASLKKAGLINRKKVGQAFFFELNALPSPLKLFFSEIKRERYQKRFEIISRDAINLGPFQEDARQMIRGRTK